MPSMPATSYRNTVTNTQQWYQDPTVTVVTTVSQAMKEVIGTARSVGHVCKFLKFPTDYQPREGMWLSASMEHWLGDARTQTKERNDCGQQGWCCEWGCEKFGRHAGSLVVNGGNGGNETEENTALVTDETVEGTRGVGADAEDTQAGAEGAGKYAKAKKAIRATWTIQHVQQLVEELESARQENAESGPRGGFC